MLAVNETIVRVSLISKFRDVIAGYGVDVGALLSEAGLDRGALDDPGNELLLDAVAHLLELASERTRDPAFGLTLAESFPVGATGLFGYLIMHAPTVREALQTMVRYSGLLFYPGPVEFREDAHSARLAWLFPTRHNKRRVQFALFANALVMMRLKKMAGRDWSPLAIEVEHPELGCSARLQRVYGPRVNYNARENIVVINRYTLERPNKGADPQLFQILQETAEMKLQDLAGRSDVVARTAHAITEVLNTGAPLLERVAEWMRLSPRSLQNRLAQHGTTFERVLSDTRRNLAERYLRDSDLPLTEIAFQLGFSEQSAFTRAARAWFGRPPSQLRKEGRWAGKRERTA